MTRCPIDRQPFAFADDRVPDSHDPLHEIDLDGAGSHDGGFAELAGDERSVTCSAATARDDSVGGEHAVDVVGSRLRANHDDVPTVLCPSLRQIGVERHHADRCAWRHVEAGGEVTSILHCRLQRRRNERRVEEEVDLAGGDPQ